VQTTAFTITKRKISDEVRKITNQEGVDIVIEHVGAATWDESVKSLKSSGTLVTCGATTGPSVGIDLPASVRAAN